MHLNITNSVLRFKVACLPTRLLRNLFGGPSLYAVRNPRIALKRLLGIPLKRLQREIGAREANRRA